VSPHELRRRAVLILEGAEPIPEGGEIQRAQIIAVELGDADLLALWSRVRWRWALAHGYAACTRYA
jgi:hypothetical protein